MRMKRWFSSVAIGVLLALVVPAMTGSFHKKAPSGVSQFLAKKAPKTVMGKIVSAIAPTVEAQGYPAPYWYCPDLEAGLYGAGFSYSKTFLQYWWYLTWWNLYLIEINETGEAVPCFE